MRPATPFSTALGRIAWGYLFLSFDINLNTLNILPDWACYLLLLSALPVLAQWQPSLLLLRPLAILLALWEGFKWLLTLFQGSFSMPLLATLAAILALYLHFQLLTDLARLCGQCGLPHGKTLLVLRNINAVLSTATALLGTWGGDHFPIYLWVCLVLAGLVVILSIAGVLFSLARQTADRAPPEPE